MPSDNLTFLIGFAAIFGALGWYLWHLEREVARLAQRVEDATASSIGSGKPNEPWNRAHQDLAEDAGRGGQEAANVGARSTGGRGTGGSASTSRQAAAREAAHIEQDATPLPHGPARRPDDVDDDATRAKRGEREDAA